jgi:alpha-tubulin suppressor-like RCC1 family protein
MSDVKSIAAGGDHSLFLRTDGTLWACGDNYAGQLGDGTEIDRSTPVQVLTGVKSMAAGYDHNLILKTDSTLWACGNVVELIFVCLYFKINFGIFFPRRGSHLE